MNEEEKLLILVEGSTDKAFIETLIEDNKNNKEITIEEIKGKDNLRNFMKGYLKKYEYNYEKLNIGYIRDKDNESEKDIIESVIKDFGDCGAKHNQNLNFSYDDELEIELKLYLLPGGGKNGELEDVLYDALIFDKKDDLEYLIKEINKEFYKLEKPSKRKLNIYNYIFKKHLNLKDSIKTMDFDQKNSNYCELKKFLNLFSVEI